jgi:uncharacterized membrane protein
MDAPLIAASAPVEPLDEMPRTSLHGANVQSPRPQVTYEQFRMTTFAGVAEVVMHASEWLRLALETLGALSIAVGMFAALGQVARSARTGNLRFTETRFALARYLALALEFQLAADILETAVSPSWQDIGQLAAIATIRTALNYFLTRELADERHAVEVVSS